MRRLMVFFSVLGLVIGVSSAAFALDDAYFTFGSTAYNGNAVDSYGSYVFGVSNAGIQGWEVVIPDGADPNDRDYNGTGTFAPRTFNDLGTFSLGGVYSVGSSSELYVSDGVMWYGSADDGNLEAFTWNVSGGVLAGSRDVTRDVAVSNSIASSETLGYDSSTNTWYAGTRTRGIYHLDGTGNWIYDFTYMNMSGGHMDGMEMVDGNLWVSDMTSDHLAMYQNLGTVAAPDWQIFDADEDGTRETTNFDDTFNYNYSAYVEGMGYGAFDHFWVTSNSSLYELGGGALQGVIEDEGDGGDNPVPEPSTIILMGIGLAGLAGYRRKKLSKK